MERDVFTGEGDGPETLQYQIQSQLSSSATGSQCSKVLGVIFSFLEDRLSSSFKALQTEQRLRRACEEQLVGLSSKVNDLKGEYSRALKLREDEVKQYEKEVQKLFEGNKRKAELLHRARDEWSSLQTVPEMLQRKKEKLLQLEKNCMIKHVVGGYSDMSDFDLSCSKNLTVEQLRYEVAKTWDMINQQQKLMEKLLDQLHATLDADQTLVHDCNGNVISFPHEAVNYPGAPQKTGQTNPQINQNITYSLLDTLISIGSLCRTGSHSGTGFSDPASNIRGRQDLAMEKLNSRIEKFEKIVRSFDDKKLADLKEKLSAKIKMLENKSRLNR